MSIDGTRQEKLDRLQEITLDDRLWGTCDEGWQRPFLASLGARWESYPQITDIMPWSTRGVTTGRNWVYAPDADTLALRWSKFLQADTRQRRSLFNEAPERTLDTKIGPLPGFRRIDRSLAEEVDIADMAEPIQVGYRSFDRQWLIPDNRVMVRPRPPLWLVRSDRQVYVTEQSSHSITRGPGLTFSAYIPDIHHYNARSGRITPLYRDSGGIEPNMAPGFIPYLNKRLRTEVSSEDVLAYIAGVAAHSGYTARFSKELKQPGIRIPFTISRSLWERAVELGELVLWLHTYGTRYVDKKAGRRRGLDRLVEACGPKVVTPISDTPENMPEEFWYDKDALELHVGDGVVAPVPNLVWEYEVSDFRVMRKWLDYRMKRPKYKRKSSGLDEVNCARWTPHFTDELLELVAVLSSCVDLEERQRGLLAEIVEEDTISLDDLHREGVLPVQPAVTRPPNARDLDKATLF